MGLSTAPPTAIVAIPAKDEAERIAHCLAALSMQRTRIGTPLARGAFAVLVFANDCRDATAEVARAFADLPFPLHVVEETLPPALSHAGGARRVALDLAAERIGDRPGSEGVLLTTDADSRVAPTWIAENLAAIAAGADAVAGYVDAEASEYVALGQGFLERGRREDRFLALVAELQARLDPRPHDPWPNHRVHSGASFAVTLSAYRAIGGLPVQPLGEDAALALALESHGFRIRHSLDCLVTTSCRFESRARGGAGDTMKARHAALDADCDADLEPAARLLRRFGLRGRIRALHATGRLGDGRALARWLRLDAAAAAEIVRDGATMPFARIWTWLESESPALRRGRPLRPSDLPVETARLARLLSRLSPPRRDARACSAARGARLPAEAAVASPR